MKVSVVIPTYNSAALIQATLDSVLRQTTPPDEILVLDDGSTDGTVSILNSYKPRITVFEEMHKGNSFARNALCERAQGDLIACLDSDDIWHPNYLEVQCRLWEHYPNAIAFFTGHMNFDGDGDYQWDSSLLYEHQSAELITPLSFIKRYTEAPGPFVMDCCIPKWVLREIGREPFGTNLRRADDCYFFCLIAPLGPVVYASVPLVAYRITKGSVSENHLKLNEAVVHAFGLLEESYRKLPDVKFWRAFQMAFASKRRLYAKILMGTGMIPEARRQFYISLKNTSNPLSLAKSLTLLFLTYMPSLFQPKWPLSHREWKNPNHNTSTENETSTAPRVNL